MIDVNLSRKSNGAGTHDQIIHFINGSKRLIQGVKFVWENEMVHIVDYLGVEYIINKSNVLMVERISKGGEGHGKTVEHDRDEVRGNRRPARKRG